MVNIGPMRLDNYDIILFLLLGTALKMLVSRDIRNKWEEKFGQTYIHPLLEVYMCIHMHLLGP